MKLILFLATGLGLGLSPIASGTFGSLLGIPIVWLMYRLPLVAQIVLAGALCVLAVPICHQAEKRFGKKDDGRIVADEYLTFPLCLLGLPWMEHLWLLPMAFVVARFLDIVKPPPAYQAQSLPGGAGIVIDDVVSSLYALAVNHVIFRLVV